MTTSDLNNLLNLSCDEPSERYDSGYGSSSGGGYGYGYGSGGGGGYGGGFGYGYGSCDTPEIIEIINTGHAPEKASLT